MWAGAMKKTLLFLLATSCSAVVLGSAILANFEPVLLFPQPTLFQFTVAVSTPIAMDKKGGIGFNYGFQFNYVMPSNLSQFRPLTATTSHARDTREAPEEDELLASTLNLDNLYLSLEELLDTQGWSDGRECLLRIICELAQTPLVRSPDARDVLEEIVHLLLTPSEDEQLEDGAYLEAELVGRRRGEECGVAYAGCPRSPLDSFTEIVAPGFG